MNLKQVISGFRQKGPRISTVSETEMYTNSQGYYMIFRNSHFLKGIHFHRLAISGPVPISMFTFQNPGSFLTTLSQVHLSPGPQGPI